MPSPSSGVRSLGSVENDQARDGGVHMPKTAASGEARCVTGVHQTNTEIMNSGRGASESGLDYTVLYYLMPYFTMLY